MPKNIYGVTKTAAEDLCELFHHEQGSRVWSSAHAVLP